jgi:hypothetical protein
LPARLEIRFISNQQLHDILVPVFIDLSKPVLDILEGLSISDIIDENDAVRSLVV